MFHPIQVFLVLSTSLIVSCASGPSGESFDSPIGVWSEKYESSTGVGGGMKTAKFTIIDETEGMYPNGRVMFYAIDEQRKWKGYWINDTGNKTVMCSDEKGGSPYWGEQIYQFNETYNQYTGTWDVCGEGQKYKTSGVR